jgi:hypothetical protein
MYMAEVTALRQVLRNARPATQPWQPTPPTTLGRASHAMRRELAAAAA